MYFEVTKTTQKLHVGCLPKPALCQHHGFHVGPCSRRVHWALEEAGSVSLRSSDRRCGTLPELFPGPPLVLKL